jgi:hypothetical protein
VDIGDDSKNVVKGIGEVSLQLDSSNHILIRDILFVQNLKKNVHSISSLEDKGFRVYFVDGFIIWLKNSSIDKDIVIGVQEGRLYKLKGHQEKTLVHNSVRSSEIWNQRTAHIKYRVVPIFGNMVIVLIDIQVEHDGVYKGYPLGKYFKGIFSGSGNRSKGILDIIHSNVCGKMMVPSLGNFVYYVLFIDDYS